MIAKVHKIMVVCQGESEDNGAMHEATLVRNIIEIAEREARRHGAARITRIGVRVGEFRGVVAEALQFSFAVLKTGSLVAEGLLEVETVPLRLGCPGCGAERQGLADLSFSCAACGGRLEIRSGREFEVESLDFDTE